MAEIELPNSALPLVASEPRAEVDVAGARAGGHRRVPLIGVGATLAWFALVLGYIVHQTGARAFVALPAHELAMAAAGVAAPAILLWLVLLYLRRGEAFERHARALEGPSRRLGLPRARGRCAHALGRGRPGAPRRDRPHGNRALDRGLDHGGKRGGGGRAGKRDNARPSRRTAAQDRRGGERALG